MQTLGCHPSCRNGRRAIYLGSSANSPLRTHPNVKKISSSIESSTAKSWPLDTIVGLAESGVGVRDEVRGPLEPSPRFRRRDQERPHMASISNGIPDGIISKYMTNLICKQQSSSQSFVLAKLRSKLAKLHSTHRKGPSEHRNPYLNTKGSQITRYLPPPGGPRPEPEPDKRVLLTI